MVVMTSMEMNWRAMWSSGSAARAGLAPQTSGFMRNSSLAYNKISAIAAAVRRRSRVKDRRTVLTPSHPGAAERSSRPVFCRLPGGTRAVPPSVLCESCNFELLREHKVRCDWGNATLNRYQFSERERNRAIRPGVSRVLPSNPRSFRRDDGWARALTPRRVGDHGRCAPAVALRARACGPLIGVCCLRARRLGCLPTRGATTRSPPS
jgi:hypothetical protein